MNDAAKRTIIVIVVVLAVIGAGVSAYFTLGGEKVSVARRGPPPPKGQLWGKAAMMAHDNGTAPSGSNPAATGGGGQ